MIFRRGDCSPAFTKVHAGLPDPNRELQLPSDSAEFSEPL